jgi:hypothetical protein
MLAFSGYVIDAWGLKISSRIDPDVQKCLTAADALKSAMSSNADVVEGYNKQILDFNASIQKEMAAHTTGNVFEYKQMIQDLQRKQDLITRDRMGHTSTISVACKPR